MFNFFGSAIKGAQDILGGFFNHPQPKRPPAPQNTLRQQVVQTQPRQTSNFNQLYAGSAPSEVVQSGDAEAQRQAAAAQAAEVARRQAEEAARQRQIAQQAQAALKQAQDAIAQERDKTAYGPEMQAIQTEASRGGQANLDTITAAAKKLQQKKQANDLNNIYNASKTTPLTALGNKTLEQYLNEYNAADAGAQEKMMKQLQDSVNNSNLTFGDTNTKNLNDQATLAAAVLQQKGNHKFDILNSAKDLATGLVTGPVDFAKKMGVVAQTDLGNDPFAQIQADYKAGKINKAEMIKRTNQLNTLIGGITGSTTGQDKGTLDRALRAAGMGAEGAMYAAPLVAGGVAAGLKAAGLGEDALGALTASRSGLAGEAAFQAANGGLTSLEKGTDVTPEDVLTGAAVGAGLGTLTAGATHLIGKLARGKVTAADAAALSDAEKEQVVNLVAQNPELQKALTPEVAQELKPKAAAAEATPSPEISAPADSLQTPEQATGMSNKTVLQKAQEEAAAPIPPAETPQAPAPPKAAPTTPAATQTNPDYLAAKAKIEAGTPEAIIPAEQKAYDAVMGKPNPKDAVKRATTAPKSAEETLFDPTTGKIASNKTAERLMADPTVPKAVKKSLSNITHAVHNEALMIKAGKDLVAKDPEVARTLFDSGDLALENADSHVHLGNALVDYYNARGMTDEADEVYNDMIGVESHGGQTLRAGRSISKISPQGIVRYAQKVADKAGKPLSDDVKKALQDAAMKITKMPDGPEKEGAIKDMLEVAKQKGTWDKVKEAVGAVLSLPKSLKTTLDLSFGLRQGATLGASHPITFAKVEARSIRYAFDPAFYARDMKGIVSMTDKNGASLYPLFKKMGLALEGIHGGSEEYFGNTSLAEGKVAKKLLVGHLVAGSDRAYTGAANKLRADVVAGIVNNLGGVAEVTKMTTKELRDLGRVINTATGRGEGGKLFEQAVPALNQGLFAARFWKSRLDMLNPLYYASLKGPARQEAIKATAAYAGLVALTLTAAKQAGLSVEMDPRSSDFAKIKVGNTRYDILGGFQQNIVFAARELSGQTKSVSTGEVTDKNRLEAAATLGRDKLAPVPGTIVNILDGKDVVGNPTTPASVIAGLLLPMGIQDAADGANDTGSLSGVLKTAPGLLGIGVQTFGKTQPGTALSQGQLDKLNPQQFDTYVKQSKNDFKNTLSPGDQALYKVYGASSAYQQKMLQSGKVTQDQLDAIKARENRFLVNRGLPINLGIDQGVYGKLSPEERAFVQDRAINGGIKKDNAQTVSDAAKAVLTKAFEKENWPNVDVSGVKMTNALATKWIDYQTALQKAGDDQAAQYDAQKTFWGQVVRQKYDKTVTEVYDLGGSTNPRNTYGMALGTIEKLVSPEGITIGQKNYHIGKTDLDNMVALDDELLSAGLIATPKFSNKVRAAYGYGAAPTSGVDGVGYAGSKGKKGSGGRSGRGGGRAPAENSTHPNQLLTDFGGQGGSGLKDIASKSTKAAPAHLDLGKYQNKKTSKQTIKIKL